MNPDHQRAASAAALPDGWGKSFQKLKQSFPTITVEVFFRLVQRVKPAGFTDDEFAVGIEEHGRHILSRDPEVNPITFGLKVIDSITAARKGLPKPGTLPSALAQLEAFDNDSPTPPVTQAELPPHEPSIGLSSVRICPKHKHEVVWTPTRGKEVCVECTEPPGELASEAKERVERWLEAEKEIEFGSGPKQLTERLARL